MCLIGWPVIPEMRDKSPRFLDFAGALPENPRLLENSPVAQW
jgi:hypothetical protein